MGDIVSSLWTSECHGVPEYQVTMKLKLLKIKLKEWACSGFDYPGLHIRRLQEEHDLLMHQPATNPEAHNFERLKEISKELGIWINMRN